MWFVGLVRRSFPHRFLAARLTKVPGLGRVAERALFEGDDILILPSARSIEVGEEVGAGESAVLPYELVERFVKKAGYRWIMDSCICRQATGCSEYPEDLGCLFLGEAAREINRELGREATEEEALEHLARCRDAGLFHLIGRNRLDTVWLKARPGERLLTICNCCTCCCIWRVIPYVSHSIESKVSRMPGVEVSVTQACTGCGTCVEGCMFGGVTVSGGLAVIGPGCRGCGRCAELCPEGAVEVSFDAGLLDGIVERLSAIVDVG